jgi:Tol biopolymer transport system component
MDSRGNFESAIDSAAKFWNVAVSPDGRRIAVVKDGDVWTYDRVRKLYTRLTRTEQREQDLVWTPDGREVIYVRDEPQFDIFKRAVDGGRPEERVLTSSDDKSPSSISPDGKTLLFDDASNGTNDVWMIPLNAGPSPERRLVLSGPAEQRNAVFSPDGHWLAYQSNESGKYEIYFSPFPIDRGPSREQVSTNGGEGPQWSVDGKLIYFQSGGRVYRVAVRPEVGEIGTPEALPQVDRMTGATVAPDGRLLIGRTPQGVATQSVNVILNWASTVKH